MAMFGDCLVLHIREIETTTRDVDTDLFVLYDKNERCYVLRGKRLELLTRQFKPYSFMSSNAEDVFNFINFVVCSMNRITYVLYNYNNLPQHSDEITYDYLSSLTNRSSEIAAYDNLKFQKKQLRKLLNMLQGVFNYY